MNKVIKNKIIAGVVFLALSWTQIASATTLKAKEDEKIAAKISKTGLNRISNPPYQITQVTGDESKFRLKFDSDGSNIYLMPLVSVGEKIEISIRNNVGFVQDMELEVANVKGQVIHIDSKLQSKAELTDKKDIIQMLKAMKLEKAGKFYIQDTAITLAAVGKLEVVQTKLIKWQDLVGGVFKVSNKTRESQILELERFIGRFDNPVASFADKMLLAPKETGRVFIIQRIKEQ